MVFHRGMAAATPCEPVEMPAQRLSICDQCQSCWHIVEQTPEGYDFEYDLGPPKRVLAEKAREEREAAERLKRWTTGRW